MLLTTTEKMRTFTPQEVRERWHPCWNRRKWDAYVRQFCDEPWNALDVMSLRDVHWHDRVWLLHHDEWWSGEHAVILNNAVAHHAVRTAGLRSNPLARSWLVALDRTHAHMLDRGGDSRCVRIPDVHNVGGHWDRLNRYVLSCPPNPPNGRPFPYTIANTLVSIMDNTLQAHRLHILVMSTARRVGKRGGVVTEPSAGKSANEWFDVFTDALCAYHVNDARPDFF